MAGTLYRLVFDGTSFRVLGLTSGVIGVFPNVNVTGNTIPANGMYLPAPNTLGFATNGVLRETIGPAGVDSVWEGVHNVGAAVLMPVATVESGTFVGTLVGCTTAPTATFNWSRVGTKVTIFQNGSLFGISNTTSLSLIGLPIGLRPPVLSPTIPLWGVTDNGSTYAGMVLVSQSTTMTFFIATVSGTKVLYNSTAFTNTGNKGLGGITFTYDLGN